MFLQQKPLMCFHDLLSWLLFDLFWCTEKVKFFALCWVRRLSRFLQRPLVQLQAISPVPTASAAQTGITPGARLATRSWSPNSSLAHPRRGMCQSAKEPEHPYSCGCPFDPKKLQWQRKERRNQSEKLFPCPSHKLQVCVLRKLTWMYGGAWVGNK